MWSVSTFIHRAVLVFIFGLFSVSGFIYGEEAALPEQMQAQLKAAGEIKKSGDIEGAKAAYADIIKTCPNTAGAVKAYQEAAILCIQSKQTKDAESLVESLKTNYSTFPETVDALHSVAQHWQWNNLPEQALRLYRYNSATYPNTKKGMWSQGEIVNYYIKHKDFVNAQKEYEVVLDRFKDQPTLPQEIHQFAEKYRETDEIERALELHRYNITHSPVSSMYTMWSQGAIVHYYINVKDFVSAQRECEVMTNRFSDQPTLPQELHLIAEKLKGAGQADRSLDLHRYNATHSPIASQFTMWSQGALVHYYIEQRDFYPADVEYKELLSRFKDQPTLPEEIYQFALKYNSVGEAGKALELHRYNATHSPLSSKFTMWSQGAIVNYYIGHKDFVDAQKEYEAMLDRFKDQPTLPQEIHQFALKYHDVGEAGKALELHRYNATHSDVSSEHTMWSQGALVHYYIEQKDFVIAQKEYEVMLERFKDQPTLPKEIYQVADKFQQFEQYGQSRNLCGYGLKTYPDCSWRHDFQKVLIKTCLAESDYEQAASVSAELISESSDRSADVKTMTDLGHIYREGKQWDQAIQYYQQALEKAELPEDELDAYRGMAMTSVCLGNDAKVQEIVDLILKDYKEQPRTGYAIFMIGEEYYLQGGIVLADKDSEKAKIFYSKALSIWDNNINQIEDSRHRCLAYYYSAVAYQNTGEMDKAMQFYDIVVTQWPDYEKAWDAQFMIVRICRDLRREGKLAKASADPIIRSGCVNVLQRYPQCPVAGIAQRWLEEEANTQR